MPPVVQDAYINYKMRIVIYNIIQGKGGPVRKERERERKDKEKREEMREEMRGEKKERETHTHTHAQTHANYSKR